MPLRRTFDSLTPVAAQWHNLPRTLRARFVKVIAIIGLKISQESQKRAPVLKGNIIASHNVVTTRNQPTRLTMEVQVGNGSTDRYLEIMHETVYGLGPRSAAKQAGQPEIVGRKFLERGFAAVEEEAVKEIFDTVMSNIK